MMCSIVCVLQLMKSFSLRLLQSWVKDSLVQNPFGISACIASGRRLSWPMAGEIFILCFPF